MNHLPGWLKLALSTIVFWLIILLMPFVLSIWNYITPYRMEPGSLEYLIFAVAAQPLSALAACYALHKIAPGGGFIALVVNVTIACLIFVLLALQSFLWGSGWEIITSHILSFIVLIYTCVHIKRHPLK